MSRSLEGRSFDPEATEVNRPTERFGAGAHIAWQPKMERVESAETDAPRRPAEAGPPQNFQRGNWFDRDVPSVEEQLPRAREVLADLERRYGTVEQSQRERHGRVGALVRGVQRRIYNARLKRQRTPEPY